MSCAQLAAAFASTSQDFPFDRNGPVGDVFFKHLIDGQSL